MTASADVAAAARQLQGRVPDFFIVGHAKSGTTALYEMLRRHPQIYMPDAKEPWFLASDMAARFQPRRAGEMPRTLEQYLSLFAAAAPSQLAGEASSSYLWSATAAGRIAELQPDARIIAILREPASFLRSLHLQLLQTHVESEKDFRRAMSLEGERREGRSIPPSSHRPQLLQYADHVRYAEQLSRYREAFGAEQMQVLIYDDFRSDNEATVRSVMRFLDVDADRPLAVLDANPSILLRSQRLDTAVHAFTVGRGGAASRAARATVKAVLPRRLRRDALALTRQRIVHGRPPETDAEFMRELRLRFRDEVLAAGEYLQRDLAALWGYDQLD
jgi:hypothetical protein